MFRTSEQPYFRILLFLFTGRYSESERRMCAILV
nr:MAG TPA: hypothetical protein [Bacteriophage sp.]